MSSDKSLNKSKEKVWFMNTIDRENYKCLNACTDCTKAKIKSLEEDGIIDFKKKCPINVEKRLISKGWINHKNKGDHIITDSGMKELNRLELMKWKFGTWVSGIVIAICAVITLGRFMKWW